MWMNTELTVAHKNFIYDHYPAVWELHCCIKDFRNIFKKRNVPLLYLFIEKYCKSKIKALKSFAEGLKRDIDAVENAVVYDYSNGFVEGTNSRLKMIKRKRLNFRHGYKNPRPHFCNRSTLTIHI